MSDTSKYEVTEAMLRQADDRAHELVDDKSWPGHEPRAWAYRRAFAEEVVRLATQPKRLRRVEVTHNAVRCIEATEGGLFAVSYFDGMRKAMPRDVIVTWLKDMVEAPKHNYPDATRLVAFLEACHTHGPWETEGE